MYANQHGPVHISPEEFKNGGFTLKTHQMFFFVYTTSEEFINATFTSAVGTTSTKISLRDRCVAVSSVISNEEENEQQHLK